ncbi:MAG TPA: POTRA domain-containing protein [Myxococcales bacterium]|nr:POTRA domain-containing protein [Myxococcales bacterium]
MAPLLLLAALGLLPSGPEPPEAFEARGAPRVESIELVAPAGVDLSGIEPLLMVRQGQPFSGKLVRRTVELLYEAGRFANVLVYERPAKEGVALIFRLVPKLRLTGVGFHGNVRLGAEELRAVSALRPGEEFFPERLRAAIEAIDAAYRRIGWRDVRISPQVTTGVTQAEVEFEIEEGEPRRARSVAIVGDLELPRAEIERTLGWRRGMVLDLDAMDQGVHRLEKLYHSRRHYQAQVGPYDIDETGPGETADVRLHVNGGPTVDLRFRGNVSFTARELRKHLDFEGDERLDDAEIGRLILKLRTFYVTEGFFDARVEVATRQSPGQLVETFRIDEGLPLRVSKIDVVGAHRYSSQEIREQILGVVQQEEQTALLGQVDSAAVDALGVSGRPLEPEREPYRPDSPLYVPDLYAEAAQQVADRYRDDGYLAVSVPPPSVDIDERRRQAVVHVRIEEGRRTLLHSVRFDGVALLGEAAAEEAVGLRIGAPYSRSALDRARADLIKAYGRRGFPFVRVEEEEEVSPGDPEGSVLFKVDEGPLVHVGQILVEGPRHTRPELIKSRVALADGQLLDMDKLALTQQNLIALGLFDQVQISLIDPDVPDPVKDVLIVAHERKRQNVVFGGGYSLVEGPRAFVEYTFDNLGGRNLRLQNELKLNYFPASLLAFSGPSGSLVLQGLPPAQVLTGQDNLFGFAGRVDSTLDAPAIFTWEGGRGSARGEVLAESIDRPYYAFRRGAVVPSLDFRFGKRVDLTFQVQGEVDDIHTYWANLDQVYQFLSTADLQNLRFPDGLGWLGSTGPALSWDLRDDPVDPHRGFLASGKASWVGGVFTPSGQAQSLPEAGSCLSSSCGVDLVSLQAQVAGYIPLSRRVTVALFAKGGDIVDIGNSFVIPTQRFFLGGADSDRGFQQDLMLPEDVRHSLHGDVARCGQTATGVSCSTAAQLLRTPSNQLPSPGGQVFDDFRAELRVPVIPAALDAVAFFDAGDLWSDPNQFSLLEWRPAAGLGVRIPTPIGAAVLDVGFNLDPDWLVNETLVQFHFALGTF